MRDDATEPRTSPILVSALPDQQDPRAASPASREDSAVAGPSPLPSPDTATGRGLGATLTPILLTALAVAAAVAGALADPRVPTATDWHITGVLAGVGIVGALVGYRFNPPDIDSAPPWDVHTVWLLPAALLTPPAAFGVLVVLSLLLGLIKRAHPLRWRVVVASITVLTTVAVHAATQLISGFALSAVVGIAALWIIGAVIALVVAHVIGTPSGTVLWLDDRWSLVELGCAFSGMLVAAALRIDPWLGCTALAPLLFAAFALRWPELSWHARIDPKTGLPNAWHWEERSRALLAAAELRGTPVAVMIIDIDRFKLVNDTYGHLAGDQVLGDLADTLRSVVRPGDLLGRFGGEEFVVTMFGAPPNQAVAAAERIRARVVGQRHMLSGPRGEGACSITCTIGLAAGHRHGYDLTRLLDRADVALAAGKAAGRNRVQVAGVALPGPGTGGSADPRSAASPRSGGGEQSGGGSQSSAGQRSGAGEQSSGGSRSSAGRRSGGARSRSLLSLPARRRSDRRTLRHGPGSMFR